jgi:hypothetical protein
MTPLRRMLRGSVLLIGLAAATVAGPGRTSTAGATEPGWLVVPGGLPLFDLANIAPGDSGAATLTVTNPQAFPVRFSVAVTALANDDNGCNEPEEAIGDTTCGPGGGELQFDLRLSLATGDATERHIATGTVTEWAFQPAVDTFALGGNETRTYRVGYSLPTGSSNVTQSDLISFQFEMRLDQAFDSVASDPPPALIVATPSLPRTGTDMFAIVMVAASTIVMGVGLYRMSARKRRSS